MIRAEKLSKHFEKFVALEHVTCTIDDGCIYGMVGSNGAGKSTFLRTISGVYKPDGGSVFIDEQPVWDNPKVKGLIAYIPDELYFLNNASMDRMAVMYQSIYPQFDMAKYRKLAKTLELDTKKSLNSFSKGMKRQAATILALATQPKYLFFDETFDGLDPVMRNFIKGLICEDVYDRGVSAIITSHSLRELEDMCDQLALLHKGGLVVESDIQDLKTVQFKIQVAFTDDYDQSRFEGIEISHFSKQGSVANMIVRGDRQSVVERLKAMNPTVLDVLPLSLEEVFTYEMETLGYTFHIE